MNSTRLYIWLDKVIEYAFYALVFFVPLFLTKWNYELFEYNKMMMTYGFTILIVGAWLGKMALAQRVLLKRTPLDIPILLFFLSQLASFIFSMDPHVSFWGYYSRFHGGLLSTITYITLYYALVSNFLKNPKFEALNPKQIPNSKSQIQNKSSFEHSNLGHLHLFRISDLEFRVYKLLLIALSSGVIISIYGILEHFGSSFSCLVFTGSFDVRCWVQDVQNRVFATLGQPNWLAAYMAILIPPALGLALIALTQGNTRHSDEVQSSKFKVQNYSAKFKNEKSLMSYLTIRLFVYSFIGLLFYLTLLYTKSRSGYLGFWSANAVFWFILWLKHKQTIVKPFIICHLAFVIIHFFVGSPFEQLNGVTWHRLTAPQATVEPAPAGPALESGGTESGAIRRIVWQGAWDIARDHPLFGTGVETFAFAYYKYRPLEHNITSEWDFLYNKAHNEYLNYAATTGFVGLGAYLLMIGWFVVWSLKQVNSKYEARNSKQYLNSNEENSKRFEHLNLFRISDFGFRILFIGLFCGWLSILVTNFFGFSVVVVALFFWLIPALLIVSTTSPLLLGDPPAGEAGGSKGEVFGSKTNTSTFQKILLSLILLSTLYSLLSLFRLWQADAYFAQAYRIVRTDPTEIQQSYDPFTKAIEINPSEPLYHDEFSYTLATLALAAKQQEDATLSGLLSERAIAESDKALATSPENVNFWKTRTRVMYVLGQTDDTYFEDSLAAIQKAQTLAPNDAKIAYNVALLHMQLDQTEEAIQTLKKSVTLKSDYREPRFALAQLLEEQGDTGEARKQLEYILQHINPEDKEAKEKLNSLN